MTCYYVSIGDTIIGIHHNTKKHRYSVNINGSDIMEVAKTPGETLVKFLEELHKKDKYIKFQCEADIR